MSLPTDAAAAPSLADGFSLEVVLFVQLLAAMKGILAARMQGKMSFIIY